MKKITYVAIIFILSLSISESIAQDDKSLIKSVIELETNSFYRVDSNTWKNCWLMAPYTYWSYADAKGGTSVEGTDAIFNNFKEYFRTAKPSKSKIERTWVEIKIYGNGAYARYNQKVSDDIDQEDTTEIRVLEKDKGKWKIITMSASAKNPTKK